MPTLKIVDALAILDIQPDDLQFFTSLDEEFSFIKKKFHAAARTSHPGKKVAHLLQHLPFIHPPVHFQKCFGSQPVFDPLSHVVLCCLRLRLRLRLPAVFVFPCDVSFPCSFTVLCLISSPKPLPRPSMFVRQRRNPRGISNRA